MIEVLVFAAIVGCAMLPLADMGMCIHRECAFTQHDVVAWLRARSLLDLASAIDPALLERRCRSKHGQSPWRLSPGDLFDESSEQALMEPGIDALALARGRPVRREDETRSWEHTQIVSEWIECECPDGAVALLLSASVEWKLGNTSARTHRVRLSRVVARGRQHEGEQP